MWNTLSSQIYEAKESAKASAKAAADKVAAAANMATETTKSAVMLPFSQACSTTTPCPALRTCRRDKYCQQSTPP